MDPSVIYAIVIGILTILGSSAIWKYVDSRFKTKQSQENYVKYDCRERITKLEALLEKSADEKQEMRKTILELTAMVAELRVKVEFMEYENKKLRMAQNTDSDETDENDSDPEPEE